MYQSAFQHFDLNILPIAGLLLFLITFTLIVAWSFYYARARHFEKESHLPLQEDRHE